MCIHTSAMLTKSEKGIGSGVIGCCVLGAKFRFSERVVCALNC